MSVEEEREYLGKARVGNSTKKRREMKQRQSQRETMWESVAMYVYVYVFVQCVV